MTDPLELLLDKFTDPEIKRKRKARKEDKQEGKRLKRLTDGQLFSTDMFNEPATIEEAELWSTAYILGAISEPEFQAECKKWQEEEDVQVIGYVGLTDTSGLNSVYNYLRASVFCTEWLNEKLLSIGWKRNMTQYDPITVTFFTRQLLTATLECFKMALKQKLRMDEYLAKQKPKDNQEAKEMEHV